MTDKYVYASFGVASETQTANQFVYVLRTSESSGNTGSHPHFATGTRTDASTSVPASMYTGAPDSSQTHHYYYGTRFLEPHLGRWISRDRLDDHSGLYAFVLNDPVRLYDMLGLYIADSVKEAAWKTIVARVLAGDIPHLKVSEAYYHWNPEKKIVDWDSMQGIIGENPSKPQLEKLAAQVEALFKKKAEEQLALQKECLYMVLELESLSGVTTILADGGTVPRCPHVLGSVKCKKDPKCATIAAAWNDLTKDYQPAVVKIIEEYIGTKLDEKGEGVIVGPKKYIWLLSKLPLGYGPPGSSQAGMKYQRPETVVVHDRKEAIHGPNLAIGLYIDGKQDEVVSLNVK